MKTQTLFKKALSVSMVAALVVTSTSSWTFAQESGTTYLEASACEIEPFVYIPYDINFGSFNFTDVSGGDHTNSGAVEQGASSELVSNIIGTGLFLAVEDPCATYTRTANINSSEMIDQNILNTTTATAIPNTNIRMEYFDGDLHLLNGTVANDDVEAFGFSDFIALNENRTLLSRPTIDDQTGGIFGVDPIYELIIPQYQQADSYEGTVIWDIVVL